MTIHEDIEQAIKRERKYFDIACERISRAQAQGQMFAPEEQPNPIQDSLL